MPAAVGPDRAARRYRRVGNLGRLPGVDALETGSDAAGQPETVRRRGAAIPARGQVCGQGLKALPGQRCHGRRGTGSQAHQLFGIFDLNRFSNRSQSLGLIPGGVEQGGFERVEDLAR